MSSQEYAEAHKDQRDDKGTENGGRRQKFKHVDGDFCMVHETKKRR